jgi:colicin import membrane protein
LLAGVLHAVVIGGLVFGMLPSQPKMQQPVARAPVQATAVSEADLRAVEQRRAADRAAEARRQQEAEQRRQAEIRRQREEQAAAERAQVEAERARVAAEQRAVAERQAQERRVAEEARRVEEARRAEAARQAEEARKAEQARVEAAARAKAEAEARARAEAEARRKAEEAARVEAARQAEARAQAERRAAQIEEEQRRMQLQEGSAYQLWLGDIQAQVMRNWNRPPSARAGLNCEVEVSLIPGMQVVSAEIGRCNGDDAVRRSIIAAVERASPLPRPPDAVLFDRNITFVFKPED